MPVRPSVEGKLMMRSEEVKVMGSGLLAAWSSRKKLSFGLHTVLGGQH